MCVRQAGYACRFQWAHTDACVHIGCNSIMSSLCANESPFGQYAGHQLRTNCYTAHTTSPLFPSCFPSGDDASAEHASDVRLHPEARSGLMRLMQACGIQVRSVKHASDVRLQPEARSGLTRWMQACGIQVHLIALIS